jgi:hypothetical protein
MQCTSTLQVRRTTGGTARSYATRRKASEGRCGRRTTGTEAWRRTSEHRRRTRRRAELRQRGIGRCDGGAEHYARGQGDKSLSRHCVSFGLEL